MRQQKSSTLNPVIPGWQGLAAYPHRSPRPKRFYNLCKFRFFGVKSRFDASFFLFF